MRDERFTRMRILFAAGLIAAAFLYAYFLYPGFRENLSENYRTYRSLEKEKAALDEIRRDPERAVEKITDLQGRLVDKERIGSLSPATVVGDVSRLMLRTGVRPDSIKLGAPEAPSGVATTRTQLVSLPVTISARASFDAGVSFMALLEESEIGTYRVDDFSFRPFKEGDTPRLPEWRFSIRLLYYGEL